MHARLLLPGLFLGAAFLQTGCDPFAGIVASKIFRAPNQAPMNGIEFQPAVQRIAQEAYAARFEVPVRGAVLQVGIIEPGDYALDWNPRTDGNSVWIDGPMHLDFERGNEAPDGLIVILHGFGCGKEQMLPWAFELASAGYRVAMVDLRGHGRSTGNWVGFGALEKEDLKQVLDTIESRSERSLPVGVLGVSYGGAVALHFAAEDPRVRTVVALAPFASAAGAIKELARALFPDYAAKISERTFRNAFSIGAAKGSFVWKETNTTRSVAALHRPVFLIHGSKDTWISPENSRRLYREAETGSRLLMVPGETHVSLPLCMDEISGEVRSWFDAKLAAPSLFLAGGKEESRDQESEDRRQESEALISDA
ncbi:MAG: alpha/beta hydrolase [Opitutaceae bacterium]